MSTSTEPRHCQTCRHWKATNESPDCTWGECGALGYANLQILRTVPIRCVLPIDDELLAQQGHSRFWTPREFGCVKHEWREESVWHVTAAFDGEGKPISVEEALNQAKELLK